MSETTAYGVMNLTGYTVHSGSQKSGKYYFTAQPPVGTMRTFCFFAESDGERARYVLTVIAATLHSYCLNYSDGLKQ